MDHRNKLALFVGCILLTFSLRGTTGVCLDTEVSSGFLFSCELNRYEFFTDIPSDVEVEYTAALRGYAGLPSWLSILQVDTLSSAYLYGTPSDENEGSITLEVRAMRRDRFTTEARELNLSVTTPEGIIIQNTEFYITNYNIDEFLAPVELQRFSDVLQRVFESQGARITQIVHPNMKGIAMPPPPEKHGVIVVATPGLNVATIAMATELQARSVQGDCDNMDELSVPPANFELFADEGFSINWCQFQVYPTESDTDTQVEEEEDSTVPVSRPSSEGSAVSLVAIVVVVVAVVVIITSALAWVFFGGRKSASYIFHKKRAQKAVMRDYAKESSVAPATAQKNLRNLARMPQRRRAGLSHEDERAPTSAGETELLEFQDLTDYSSHSDLSHPRDRDPPPYSYPVGLIRQPLTPQQL